MYNIVFIGCIVCIYIGKVGADCSTGCYDSWRGDGWCDSACDNAACNYDDGDCGSTSSCSFMCSNSQLGDGTCDFWCNTEACNYDDGDCTNDDNSGGGWLDDDIWTGECSLSSCPGVHQGHCGALSIKTDKWCEMGGTDVCCAQNSDECCDPNGGAIAGIVIGIIVMIGVCCYYCCNCNKNNNNNNNNNNKEYGEPPHCCFKFWCPSCAVCSHQGCDEPCDVISSLILGWFFTICCWEPKKNKTHIAPPPVYVVTSNNENNIEMPATAQMQQPPEYQQTPVYQQQPASYIVHSDDKTGPI